MTRSVRARRSAAARSVDCVIAGPLIGFLSVDALMARHKRYAIETVAATGNVLGVQGDVGCSQGREPAVIQEEVKSSSSATSTARLKIRWRSPLSKGGMTRRKPRAA